MQFSTLAVVATAASFAAAANPILLKRCDFLGCIAAAAPALASCGGALASDGANPWLDASCIASVFNDLENIPAPCDGCL